MTEGRHTTAESNAVRLPLPCQSVVQVEHAGENTGAQGSIQPPPPPRMSYHAFVHTCCHFSSSLSLDKMKNGSLFPNMPSLFLSLIPRMVSLQRSAQDATSSPRMIITPLLSRYLHQGSRAADNKTQQQQQTAAVKDKPLHWAVGVRRKQ